ncbi:pyrimidine utilization flavin reductase protein F [Rhizobium sp. JAB6]|uniref:NADH-dependent FMN reductase RutF n=1 Tax=Rhizobium sp. JAB6 TaxID=2127050 RepID=UPI000D12C76F|nr:pyrimidine utilization flavin reductase protein F [Rhizobium sp. JAB6]PST19618.1 pyrimidine utilization flavin reductase protein F [Rhizobium sp. JAB6]
MNMKTSVAIEKAVPVADPDIARTEFRNAMARMAAAVNIVTTNGPAGLAGFAATAVCSVTDSPPTLLVCLNRGASVHPAVTQNGVLCVNVLSEAHQDLSRLFGGKTPVAERFAGASWSELSTGAPVLEDALVSFDCRIVRQADGGTHDILLCEVDAIRQRDSGQGLIYFDRAYHPAGRAE